MISKLLSALNSVTVRNPVRHPNISIPLLTSKCFFSYILCYNDDYIKTCVQERFEPHVKKFRLIQKIRLFLSYSIFKSNSNHLLTVQVPIPDLPTLQNSINSLNLILTLHDIQILAQLNFSLNVAQYRVTNGFCPLDKLPL